jgi:hypothetical protein
MDAELAADAEAAGVTLAFSAAEAETLGNVAALIDRKVELRMLYDEAEDVRVKIELATEARLTESAIGRLVKTIDMCAPTTEEDAEALTPTQRKARAAAQSRWTRDLMRKRAEQQRRSVGGGL